MREKIAMLQDEVQQLNMDIEENQGTVRILSSVYRQSASCPYNVYLFQRSLRRCQNDVVQSYSYVM